MTKRQFINLLSAKNGISIAYAEKILAAFLDSVEDALFRDGRISLPGLGIFSVREIPARTGRNPMTGEVLTVDAYKKVQFRTSLKLKDMLN